MGHSLKIEFKYGGKFSGFAVSQRNTDEGDMGDLYISAAYIQ